MAHIVLSYENPESSKVAREAIIAMLCAGERELNTRLVVESCDYFKGSDDEDMKDLRYPGWNPGRKEQKIFKTLVIEVGKDFGLQRIKPPYSRWPPMNCMVDDPDLVQIKEPES